MTLLLTVLTTVTTWAATDWPAYITDIIVVGGSESEANAAKSANSGYTWCSMDLNAGAGGDYIYLGYKTSRTANTNGGYITDIIVVNVGNTTPPSTVTYNNHTYDLCPYDGGNHFEQIKGNLNSGNGAGKDLYLYYTKANINKQVVDGITINTTKSGAIDSYYKDGSTYKLYESEIDLNRGISGSTDVYMHLNTTTKINRPYPEPSAASGLKYDSTPQTLISSSYSNQNTGNVMYSLTKNGSYSTASPTATKRGDYTVFYYSSEDTYGVAGNVSNGTYIHSKSVSIGQSDNDKVTVSCADIIEGNAPAPHWGGENLSTGNVSYTYSTTQNGNYTSISNWSNVAPGTYYVKATIAADNNCKEFTTPYASFKIIRDWAKYNGGTTEADAYVITTPEQLDLLAQRVNAGNEYSGKYFKLGDNITYNHTTDWDDATSTENNYTPIGTTNNLRSFSGHFDGNGKTVSGIRIYRGGDSSENDNLGLFGYIVNSTDIRNVILVNTRITGRQAVGGIAGTNMGGTVSNCRVNTDVAICNVSATGSSHGGIVGYCSGLTEACHSSATVCGNQGKRFGGIAGHVDDGELRNNVAIGATVSAAEENEHGAIAGSMNYNGTLTNNYYTACSVAGVANATGAGCNGADCNGARQTVAIGAATGVTVTPVGDATTYGVSGITTYAGNSGIGYGGTLYAGATETVKLAVGYTVPEDCTLNGITDGNGNALTENADGTYTLTMPSANVTVTPDVTDYWGVTAGRDGSTAAKAYLITTTAGLDRLAQKVNEGERYENIYFELGDNITYDNTVENNYTPIGNDNHIFYGLFDGKGYTVSGIRIDGSGNYQALFGHIGLNSEVKNVTVADTRIVGSQIIGGIVGACKSGNITNCHVTATVRLLCHIIRAGGIAGIIEGAVSGCTSAATVGHAGNNANNGFFGGIAGSSYSGGSVENCLVLGGSVSGSYYVGAIVGYNTICTITHNYHTLKGLGGVNGSDQNGALLGYEFPTAISAMGNAASTYGTGSYTGITVYSNGLAYNGKYYCNTPWDGSGTETNPYIIYSANALDKLASNVNGGTSYFGKYFELGANITYDKSVENNFTPIGNDYRYMDGYFDGKGHTISGLNVNRPNENCVGLFGKHVGWSVKNLILANSTIVGKNYVGGIMGSGQASSTSQITIENCHVTSDVTVSGSEAVGGIFGEIFGCTVRGCISAAAVSGRSSVGSIIGNNNGGHIQDCLVLGGTVSGSNYVGAIAGNNTGTLTNNYYTVYGIGGVNGSDRDGALFAVPGSTQPDASIIGNEGTTYGTGDYTGITAYEHGLYYNGRYYRHDATPMLVLEDHGMEDNYNSGLIDANNGQPCNVVLNGRTLKKDGKWQTICLPFNVDMSDPACPLYGATYRTVTDAGISGTTLNITFAEKQHGSHPKNTLIAGVPYIIKWEGNGTDNIVNPVFAGVNPSNVGGDYYNADKSVRFIGIYDAMPDITTCVMPGYDVLLMDGDNTLCYADSNESLGACRAYFLVDPTKVGAGEPDSRLTAYHIDLGNGEILTGMFGSMPGDVDGDSVVDMRDVVAIVNHILGKSPLDNSKLAAADVNGDGKVTITDAVMLVNMIGPQQ